MGVLDHDNVSLEDIEAAAMQLAPTERAIWRNVC
jgi:hypothetical protein